MLARRGSECPSRVPARAWDPFSSASPSSQPHEAGSGCLVSGSGERSNWQRVSSAISQRLTQQAGPPSAPSGPMLPGTDSPALPPAVAPPKERPALGTCPRSRGQLAPPHGRGLDVHPRTQREVSIRLENTILKNPKAFRPPGSKDRSPLP